jgi:hypothetical protein
VGLLLYRALLALQNPVKQVSACLQTPHHARLEAIQTSALQSGRGLITPPITINPGRLEIAADDIGVSTFSLDTALADIHVFSSRVGSCTFHNHTVLALFERFGI